eukprot:gene20155-23955_t
MTTNCLNCNEKIAGKFCSNCSQASSTHRFSLAHVFKHDFIHGIFHFDKGFFYTIKELFTRPGHSIRDYFLKKWTKIDASAIFNDQSRVTGLFKVLKDYSKVTVFLHIPVIALASYSYFSNLHDF